MSATFSKQEHTVINVGEEECPRLITCVKASQGFDWNQGMLSLSLLLVPFLSFLAPGVVKGSLMRSVTNLQTSLTLARSRDLSPLVRRLPLR